MKSIVYNQDCMIGMKDYPDKYFDLAVVDPPYGIGLEMINNTGLHSNIHKDHDWNNTIPSQEYFEQIYRISKHRIIWGANYYMPFIKDVGIIVHDKIMSCEGTKIKFSHADIASCSLQKRITFFRYEWSGNRQGGTINWKNDGPDGRIHPTQKPIALYDWIYKNYLPNGGKVIDTHLGSGSNRIAADKAGNIDFTGYELDKDYFQAQEKRWKNYKQQLKIDFDKRA